MIFLLIRLSKIRSHRLSVRTVGFHPTKRGSIPLGPPITMKYKIAVIEEIHKDGLKLLKDHPNFEYELITNISEENLIKKLPNFDACTLRVSKLDEKILKHCPKLKAISRHGVGYDNVDLNFIKNNIYLY